MHINDILDLPNLQGVIRRFEAKFVRRGPDDCWEWTASTTPWGYGKISTAKSELELAHRLAYLLANGKFDASLFVLHKCDNPPCCNPNHLFLGTQKANIDDMIRKKRHVLNPHLGGETHPTAKLTEVQVRAIRADGRKHRDIAKDYGVTHTAVGYIKRRKAWAKLI
jgi:hypothetical protein